MADPFVAEIRIFPFTFAPRGWAFCNGQLLPISQNTALFSLIGTFYGGNGQTTFALPDLEGSVPVGQGQGQGLSVRDLGETGGSETVTLLLSEIPAHSHALMSDNEDEADLDQPDSDRTLARSKGGFAYNPATSPLGLLAAQALPPAGGGLPHNNLMPYLTLNFCIALQGVFPPRP